MGAYIENQPRNNLLIRRGIAFGAQSFASRTNPAQGYPLSAINLPFNYSNQTTGALVATEGQGFVGGNVFVGQNTSTSIFLTNANINGSDISSWQNYWKPTGVIVISLTATPTTFLQFQVTGYAFTTTGATGFSTFTVVNTGGSAASPFADTNAVTFTYQPN